MTPEHNQRGISVVDEPTDFRARYFESEDRILSDPSHPGYIMPVLGAGESVLNLGCGSMKLRAPGNELYVGIDPFFEPLRARKQADPSDLTIRAIGEQLPIRDRSFSVLMSRVAIMYMDVPRFIPEAYRVLEPGGKLWLTGHKFTHVALHLALSLGRRNVKDVIFRSYVVFNGLLFHYFGTMTRFPFNRRRVESFQTKGGLRRALARQGFTDIEFFVDAPPRRSLERSVRRLRRLMRSGRLRHAASQLLEWRHFLVTARKPSDSGRLASAASRD
jgi:ubiquinone/menaquinone biosynthesis C-methylase UbiE